jgi:chemotaxis protein methyltransferase CheR
MNIASADFTFVAGLVRQRSAIDLQPGKEYLVESRLQPVMRTSGESTLGSLVARLRRGDEKLTADVIDALTTNETLWFRDGVPFDAFRRHLLPAVAESSSTRHLVVWSAACSSGQEAYSLAMVLLDWLPLNPGFSARILGTDISREMVLRARAGKYSQLEVNRGLPVMNLVKYFQQSGRDWILHEKVRGMATFNEGNLSIPPVGIPPCDIVFLRNVLIYFDAETKRRVIAHVRSVLRLGGFLVLGGAESTPSLGPGWERVNLERAVAFQHIGGGS